VTDEDDIGIVIANLPPDVTEEDILDALEGLGYELQVTIPRVGNEDRVTAIVRFDDMTRHIAEKLAKRISGMPWRDRTLKAYVPLLFE